MRAKVALVRAAQGAPGSRDHARDLVALARRRLRRGRVRLVLVGGLPGTGKSTLAQALSDAEGWALLRSDEVRKDLHGVAHGDPLPTEAYGRAASARTYAEMRERGGRALRHGLSVVLDATWLDADERAAAQALADATASDLHALRCVATPAAVRRRLAQRAAPGPVQRHASDADLAVHDALAPAFAPWPEARSVDTTGPLDASLALARRATAAPA